MLIFNESFAALRVLKYVEKQKITIEKKIKKKLAE